MSEIKELAQHNGLHLNLPHKRFGIVTMVWGVIGRDADSDLPQFDSKFRPQQPLAQAKMLAVCELIRQSLLLRNDSSMRQQPCVMEQFSLWVQGEEQDLYTDYQNRR